MEYLKKGFYQIASLLMFLVLFGLIEGFDTVTYKRISVFCMLVFFASWMLDFARTRGWIGTKKDKDKIKDS